MSKSLEEITSEIVQATIQARGQAISAAASTSAAQVRLMKEYLSDEAIIGLYATVYDAVTDQFDKRIKSNM